MNKPEWVIEKGFYNPDSYYIWHTTCPGQPFGTEYAIVDRLDSSKQKEVCGFCKKEAPDYIIFQWNLIKGK